MRHVLLPSLLIVTTLPVCAAEWHSTVGSEFSFAATIERVATPGQFRKFDVELDFDAANPEDGELRVTVDLRAADLGDPDMNAALFDPAWFDVEEFSEAVFASDEITEQAPSAFIATGMLDLKGTVAPVAVPFSWAESGAKATMRGVFILQRTDFDVGSGEWASDDAIGIDVRLSFVVELLCSE